MTIPSPLFRVVLFCDAVVIFSCLFSKRSGVYNSFKILLFVGKRVQNKKCSVASVKSQFGNRVSVVVVDTH